MFLLLVKRNGVHSLLDGDFLGRSRLPGLSSETVLCNESLPAVICNSVAVRLREDMQLAHTSGRPHVDLLTTPGVEHDC